jgi:hypothetical protein
MTMKIISDEAMKEKLIDEASKDYTATPEEDRDLMLLLNQKDVTRKYNSARKVTVVLRDLKTREWMLSHRLATVTSDDPKIPPRIDYSRLPVYNLALSLISLNIDDKEMKLPPLYNPKERETLGDLLDSIDKRSELVEGWPSAIFDNAITCFDKLMEYIQKISAPESLENF